MNLPVNQTNRFLMVSFLILLTSFRVYHTKTIIHLAVGSRDIRVFKVSQSFHLCPEMHAMAKMAKLAKNHQPLAI